MPRLIAKSKPGCKPKTTVTVRWEMPESAARLLRETLTLDAESSAFDPKLRDMIHRALGEIKETTCSANDDLLSALHAALPAVEYYHEHEGAAETLKQVRAAIAKAKGAK